MKQIPGHSGDVDRALVGGHHLDVEQVPAHLALRGHGVPPGGEHAAHRVCEGLAAGHAAALRHLLHAAGAVQHLAVEAGELDWLEEIVGLGESAIRRGRLAVSAAAGLFLLSVLLGLGVNSALSRRGVGQDLVDSLELILHLLQVIFAGNKLKLDSDRSGLQQCAQLGEFIALNVHFRIRAIRCDQRAQAQIVARKGSTLLVVKQNLLESCETLANIHTWNQDHGVVRQCDVHVHNAGASVLFNSFRNFLNLDFTI